MTPPIDTYSLRLLSPFSGTTRIIHQQQVRALSNDGVHWRIQIRRSNAIEKTEPFILYGLWTNNEGVKNFPVHLQQASSETLKAASDFVEQLSTLVNSREFPLRDNLECWLLDHDQRPLALLASASSPQLLPGIRLSDWIPCAPADHTFISFSLQQDSKRSGTGTTSLAHRDLLVQLVQRETGQQYPLRWFKRLPDASGITLLNIPGISPPQEQHLSAEHFPHLLLRQRWDDHQDQQLVNDFFQWQSPWLLTLPALTASERQLLERQACRYPLRLHALYHLYPEILDKDLVTKTLVKAKLEKKVLPDK